MDSFVVHSTIVSSLSLGHSTEVYTSEPRELTATATLVPQKSPKQKKELKPTSVQQKTPTQKNVCTVTDSSPRNSSSSETDSADEVEILQELKVSLDEHTCGLCTKGDFLFRKLLEFGGSLDSKHKHPCDICFKCYRNKTTLKKHMMGHENKDISDGVTFSSSTMSPKPKSPDNSFPCYYCSKVFKTSRTHAKHVESKHDGKYKVHACDVCPKKFSDFRKFNQHCITHINFQNQRNTPKRKCKIVKID